MRFWPPSSSRSGPVVPGRKNVGDAGSARHPTIAPGGPMPRGKKIPSGGRAVTLWLAVPDPMARQLAGSMAIATATRSPMSRNGNYFRGDPGFATHRFAGKLLGQVQSFHSPTAPISRPMSIRVGMQSGPSSMPAFPSTGTDVGLRALAQMNGNVRGRL